MSHFEQLESYIPFDLSDPVNFVLAFVAVSLVIVARYFIAVGAFFSFFWLWPPASVRRTALYPLVNKRGQILFEIKWSIIASLIFALAGVLVGLAWQQGQTKIYLNFDDYPLWYMPVSLLLFSLVHEVYFYASHRWMHRPHIFKRVHYVHHLSKEPSPWASFSFHPLESLIEAAILPILVFIIPIHPVMFIIYLTLMTLSAINNHLGYELLPKWARTLGAEKLLISATHHSLHHRLFNCNYGLYYSFLDRWLGTEPRSGTTRPE